MAFFKPAIFYVLSVFLGIFAFSGVSQAEVTASVNTISVTEGSTFTLTIKSTEASLTVNPNLSALDRDFVVSGTQKGVRNTFVNGSFNSATEWKIQLIPKNIGNLVIPAITVGKEKTRPINIQVKPASSGAYLSKQPTPKVEQTASEASADVFLKVAIDNPKPYVQGQILYISRLYSSQPVSRGVIIPPQINDAIVEKIGEDINFESTLAGRFFKVLERRFAIFPQKSGEIVIPPLEFEGEIIDTNAGNPIEMIFKQSGFVGSANFTSPFGAVKRVLIRSDPITVNVQPKPSAATGKWWLPAYNVNITQSWQPAEPVFKENEAVTRTIKITADGLTGAQIPDISLPEDDYLKVYPGKTKVSNIGGEKGIMGVSESSVVLIPTAAGELILPEIRIPWWNVKTKRMETAVLPEAKFFVKGTTQKGAEPKAQVPSYTVNSEDISKPELPKEEDKPIGKNIYIAIFLAVFGLIGLLSVLAFWLYSRRKLAASAQGKEDQVLAGRFADIEKAASASNPKKLRDALLAWSKNYWPEDPPFNVTVIGKRLKNTKLQKELEELETSLYASRQRKYDGEELLKALKIALNTHKAEEKNIKPVPDLYPQTK